LKLSAASIAGLPAARCGKSAKPYYIGSDHLAGDGTPLRALHLKCSYRRFTMPSRHLSTAIFTSLTDQSVILTHHKIIGSHYGISLR